MIGFLYPVLGLAALAALIPVFLHLIRRRELHRVTFPAIRYLRRAEQRHARRLRLRHLMLLAARVIVILLLAAAAMGPLAGRGGPADHRATALAILIDDSQSSAQIVGERNLLDLYRERVELTLELATADDEIALFSGVRPDAGVLAREPAGVREYLRGLRPAAGRTDLGSAIRRAHAWLEPLGGRAREIHIYTDLQRVSLPSGAAGASGDGDVSVFVFAPDLPHSNNGAPGDAAPEVVPLTAGRPTTVSVPLRWFGEEGPADRIVVRLVVGDDVVAVAEATFGESALLSLPAQDHGWVQGYVEIDQHGLVADDRRHFTWYARPPTRVAALGDAGPFLDHALQTLQRGGRLQLESPDAAEVWILAGGERLEEGLAGEVSVIVVPPASPLDLPRLNNRLERARIPWRYEIDGQSRGVRRIDVGAPLEGLSGLEIRLAYRLVRRGLTASDTTLLSLGDGSAWLVRGATPDGAAYMLLATPLTEEASDLPVSAVMVPFLDAALGDWVRRGTTAGTIFDGATSIRTPPRAREIRYPDGATVAAEGDAPFEATQPGNYAVLEGTDIIAAFSLNAPLAEADLVTGEPEDLEALLPEADWSWVRGTEPADWQSSVFSARRGRAAWRPLVVLLLLVSIVEAALAAAGRRRAGIPAARPRIKQTERAEKAI